jgi:hypothetical protein
MHTIAFAFDYRDLGVMQEEIQHRCDTGRAGKDLVPFLEPLVRCDDERLFLIAAIDDLVYAVKHFDFSACIYRTQTTILPLKIGDR